MIHVMDECFWGLVKRETKRQDPSIQREEPSNQQT